jgi:hypothetical protein
MRIVALGASGKAGAEIARLLATSLSQGDDLVLAGRDATRLASARDSISGPANIETAIVEASDQAAVRRVVTGADLVIVTVSRPDLITPLAQTVLEAGADWFDTLMSCPTKLGALRGLEPEIIKAGRCFVTDGGFHPGLPGVLVRWASEQLDVVTEADVSGGMRMDWQADTLSPSTIEEMLDEFTNFDLATWIDGKRRALRWTECPTVDFGEPIGRKLVVPMPLAEMDDLPHQLPSLRRCGFYISGFGPAMDYLMLPLITGMARVPALRSSTIKLTRWSMAQLASSPPPHRLVVQTEAVGERSGRPAIASVKVSGQDGYLLTAAPAVACLRRVLDRTIRKPGLHLQAHLVQPGPFLADLAKYGLDVETGVSPLG